MSAYDEGFGARRRGVEMASNPYEAGSGAHLSWREGWLDLDRHLTHRDEALDSIGWFG